jgi:hypothetical protein
MSAFGSALAFRHFWGNTMNDENDRKREEAFSTPNPGWLPPLLDPHQSQNPLVFKAIDASSCRLHFRSHGFCS